MNENIVKSDFIKILKFCSVKYTGETVKRSHRLEENIPKTHVQYRAVSKVDKERSTINNTETAEKDPKQTPPQRRCTDGE